MTHTTRTDRSTQCKHNNNKLDGYFLGWTAVTDSEHICDNHYIVGSIDLFTAQHAEPTRRINFTEMGLQHGGDVHHRIIHLKRRHVRKIADGLARERGQTTPAIDFDCSNVAFNGGKNAVWLVRFLVGLARLGCVYE